MPTETVSQPPSGRRPLAGITVVALEQAVAAPLCTRQLADLGARVIKVERPGTGDFARHYDARVRGESSHFVWANQSKESLALDLKQPSAPAVLDALLERADVLVQNLAPDADPPPRAGAARASNYPYGPFVTGDGGIVLLGVQNEREWIAFCTQVLAQPELATDPRYATNAHRQLAARHRWTKVDTPGGRVPALLPCGAPGTFDVRMDPVPSLGAHTDAILRELGLDANAIARLRASGAV
jgi:crotonobetainyl-CoA:carnitine CoA-transferase CaiB-like acyl-CoA transferase